jgi:hypothetical protein
VQYRQREGVVDVVAMSVSKITGVGWAAASHAIMAQSRIVFMRALS